MRETFSSKSWRDFSQRYAQTFGWYLPEDKPDRKVLVKVLEVAPHTAKFTDESGFIYQASADTGNVFEFIPVERAVYNTENDVLLCQRVPARQWRRGLHTSNTQVMSLVTFTTQELTFKLIATIFGPQDWEAYRTAFINKQRANVALDPTFSIIGKKVFAYHGEIGTFAREEGSIILNTPLYQQELSDLARDYQLPYIVRVTEETK